MLAPDAEPTCHLRVKTAAKTPARHHHSSPASRGAFLCARAAYTVCGIAQKFTLYAEWRRGTLGSWFGSSSHMVQPGPAHCGAFSSGRPELRPILARRTGGGLFRTPKAPSEGR